MEEKCQGKSIPWSDMEKYLALHQENMVPFVDMVMSKKKLMKIEMIESSLPIHFLEMHELITKILKQSKVLEEEQRNSKEDVQLIVGTVLRVQDRLLLERAQSKEDITKIIRSLRNDVDDSLSQLQDSANTVISGLESMAERFEQNQSKLKEILEGHKNEIITAITQQKEKEFQQLREEIKLKDLKIQELKSNEGRKEEMISNLKQTIKDLNANLESKVLPQAVVPCHIQNDQTQNIFMDLIAKGSQVPMDHLKIYLNLHEKLFGPMTSEKGVKIDKSQLASVLPHHFVQVHQLMSQILKQNKVYQNAFDEHNEVYIDSTLEVMMKLMKQGITDGKLISLEQYLSEIKPQIQQQFGNNIQTDFVLSRLQKMLKTIESHFSKLYSLLDNAQSANMIITPNPQYKQLLGAFKGRGLISQTVYEVMLKVDRKNFVAEEYVNNAYADNALPIGWATTISSPSIHATTLEKLKEFLKPGANVLDLGTGSGYIAACFAELVGNEGKVYMVDHIQQVLDFATSNIKKGNIHFMRQKRTIPVLKDGRKGLEDYAPFDMIHIGGAVNAIPPEIFAQLAPGGAIWAPVGPKDQQEIKIYKKDISGNVTESSILQVRYASLTSVQDQLGNDK